MPATELPTPSASLPSKLMKPRSVLFAVSAFRVTGTALTRPYTTYARPGTAARRWGADQDVAEAVVIHVACAGDRCTDAVFRGAINHEATDAITHGC